MAKVTYDFSDPLFEKNFLYRRLAKEHLSLNDISSDRIRLEVTNTRGPLKIPDTYHIHYDVKSIIGVDKDQMPIYGDHHIVELHLPLKYPMESPRIYMITDVWHPNIKWEGKFKGRICGNTREFGKGYDLTQLVFRIGEILQYKNYHADNTPPYPEDSMVAKWVKDFAEPKEIVNKYKEIYSDNSDLSAITQTESQTEQEAKHDDKPSESNPASIRNKFKLSFTRTAPPPTENEKRIKFKSK